MAGYPGVYTRAADYKGWLCDKTSNAPTFCSGDGGDGGNYPPPVPSPPPPVTSPALTNIEGFYKSSGDSTVVQYELLSQESSHDFVIRLIAGDFPAPTYGRFLSGDRCAVHDPPTAAIAVRAWDHRLRPASSFLAILSSA